MHRFSAGVGLALTEHGSCGFDVPLSLQNRIIRVQIGLRQHARDRYAQVLRQLLPSVLNLLLKLIDTRFSLIANLIGQGGGVARSHHQLLQRVLVLVQVPVDGFRGYFFKELIGPLGSLSQLGFDPLRGITHLLELLRNRMQFLQAVGAEAFDGFCQPLGFV